MNDATEVSASTQVFSIRSLAASSVESLMTSLLDHPVVADDGWLAGLGRLGAAVLDAALERPERLQRRHRGGAVGRRGEVHERAVSEPQDQIANAWRRFRPQLLEDQLDEPLVFLRVLRFGPIADQRPFHGDAPVLGHDTKTNRGGQKILGNNFFSRPNPLPHPKRLAWKGRAECACGTV